LRNFGWGDAEKWEDTKRLFDEFEASLSESDKPEWTYTVAQLEASQTISLCYMYAYFTGQSVDWGKKEKLRFPDRLTAKGTKMLALFCERNCGARMS
jgi:hypothetical protein